MKNENVSLDHLNLTVRNFVESVSWYKRIFGFSLVEEGLTDDGPWGVLRNGDSMLCIHESPQREMLNGSDLDRFHYIYPFGLRVQDRTEWKNILRQEKLETHYGSPVIYPHSTSWYVTDPTGYLIEVSLWKNGEVRFN